MTAFLPKCKLQAVYDLIAQTWLSPDAKAEGPFFEDWAEAPISADFWSKFWEAVHGPDEGYDALTITQAIAALGALLTTRSGLWQSNAPTCTLAQRRRRKNRSWPAEPSRIIRMPSRQPWPRPIGSLSANGFDPEVLDRNAIMLSALPPALQYLNTRILQMHDVWHLVAGYTTDSIHEVATPSFQLAQFGHNYSAMFLATAGQIAHRNNPAGFRAFFQVIAEAWQHGRTTPSMMARYRLGTAI